MSIVLTVVPSALDPLRDRLSEAAGLATEAGGDVVSVAPAAFTRAAADAAASALPSALAGGRAICTALATTTVGASVRLAETARLYRQVEEEGMALVRTIVAGLDGVPA